ncbi:hypothetical protein [Desulfovirgula thermocuniculi]|uniref:hypothetical protein n=1 Tax=Desulfovirgula thermocuniculi TaxID=348842 RepID=UPI00040AB8AB|nr:hypothetical protein [Desulfovirgula thermocuniculi]
MEAPQGLLFRLAGRGRLFRTLMAVMVLMGLVTGAVFPFGMVALGLPPRAVFQPTFVAACLLAGLLVGGANYLVVRLVLAAPLKMLAGMAREVAGGNLRCDPGGSG